MIKSLKKIFRFLDKADTKNIEEINEDKKLPPELVGKLSLF